jgi:hypothetical protein
MNLRVRRVTGVSAIIAILCVDEDRKLGGRDCRSRCRWRARSGRSSNPNRTILLVVHVGSLRMH